MQKSVITAALISLSLAAPLNDKVDNLPMMNGG